jgi:uncharacterized protein YecE (DUF72 family)
MVGMASASVANPSPSGAGVGSARRGSQACALYVGVQGFSPPDWVGTFYPAGLPQRSWLSFYSRVFDTVEMNTTFYAIPSASTVQAWRQRVPQHFLFSAKMPRAITHDKRLEDVGLELGTFLGRIKLLGSKLGAVLIQFPSSFDRRFEDRLRAFLSMLPADVQFAVEFRHRSWQDDQVLDLLRAHSVAWCINHWQDLPIWIETTADVAYFRLVGYHEQFTDLGHVQRDRTAELARLAEAISRMQPYLERVFVYVNNHYAGHAPATVNQLKAMLDLPVRDPRHFWPEQPRMLPGMEG